jgi:hypothetical protein
MTFIARRPVFCVLTWQSLEQVAVGGGLALSAHEWLLQRLGAAIAQHDMLLSLCGLYDHGKGVFNPYRESGQFGGSMRKVSLHTTPSPGRGSLGSVHIKQLLSDWRAEKLLAPGTPSSRRLFAQRPLRAAQPQIPESPRG